MNERSMRESPVESSLEGARGRRKKLMEKLADPPWKWAFMAVMALENQGCAELPHQFGWLGLEPQKGATMTWDVGYRGQSTQEIQPGSEREAATVQGSRGPGREQVAFTGPRAYLEFGPPGARPSIDRLPEGFSESGQDGISAVAHGNPRNRADVAVRRMQSRPGVSDEARLQNVMRQSIKPEDISQERAKVGSRAINMLKSHLPDPFWGIRLEYQEVQHQDSERRQDITISCRATPWAAPSVERTTKRPMPGHQLEHDVLSNNPSIWQGLAGVEPMFSSEKSATFPARMAQVAVVSRPIKLHNWNQTQFELDQARKEYSALPHTPDAGAKAADLQKKIDQLTFDLRSALEQAKASAMGSTLNRLLPLIRNNEIRIYVRFDELAESLLVIAVLDDPDTSKI